MAKIPDSDSLGEPGISVGRAPARVDEQALRSRAVATAGLGQSIERAGEGIAAFVGKRQERADELEDYEVQKRFIQFDINQDKAFDDAQESVKGDPKGFASTFRDGYDKRAREFFATVPERLRNRYDETLLKRGAAYQSRAYSLEKQKRDEHVVTDLQSQTDALLNGVSQSPDNHNDYIVRGGTLIDSLPLTPQKKFEAKRRFFASVEEQAARARIDRGDGVSILADLQKWSDKPEDNIPYRRIPPDRRQVLIHEARVSMSTNAQAEIDGEVEILRTTGQEKKDSTGKTALDRARGVLQPNQLAQWERKRLEAKLEHEAVAPLDTMSEEKIRQHIEQISPDDTTPAYEYGPKADATRKARDRAEKLLELRRKDTAAAADMDPGVKHVLLKAKEQNLSVEATWRILIAKRLEVQDRLGIARYDQRVITRREAEELFEIPDGDLSALGDPDLRKIYEAAAKKAKERYGSYAPKALRDAARHFRGSREDKKRIESEAEDLEDEIQSEETARTRPRAVPRPREQTTWEYITGQNPPPPSEGPLASPPVIQETPTSRPRSVTPPVTPAPAPESAPPPLEESTPEPASPPTPAPQSQSPVMPKAFRKLNDADRARLKTRLKRARPEHAAEITAYTDNRFGPGTTAGILEEIEREKAGAQ